MQEGVRYVLLTAAFAAMCLAVPAVAQQSRQNSQETQGMQGAQSGTMQHGQNSQSDMMQKCHKEMQQIRQSNDQLSKHLEAAKQSNDPAKMRAALDEAEQALAAMDRHMDGCMSMMNNMHSGDHMQHGSSANPPKH